MANEITLGYFIGSTLTYGVYQPDGTVRTAAGTALNEEGATGYYHATDANITAGDIVIVKEGTVVVAYGEYKPEVTNSAVVADIAALDGKIDIIDTNVDTLITAQQTVNNVFDAETPIDQRPRIINL